MNEHASGRGGKASLFERAAEVYDLGSALRGRTDAPAEPAFAPQPASPSGPFAAPSGQQAAPPRPTHWSGPIQPIDRIALAEGGYLVPDGPVTAMSEEYRIVKRQLLAATSTDIEDARSRRILVCSAQPGEGKTFSAINLALSIAAEKDREVLLVDGDFANPSIPQALGLTPGLGLMDALADPAVAVEDCVIRTEIPTLAVLPAGQQTNNDTEYLASARTEQVFARLGAAHPNRIILFDSPPLLAASPASVLAAHVGQALLVVRADVTTEGVLRDAAGMLRECPQVRMLLNGVKFATSGRRFGSYYGKAG